MSTTHIVSEKQLEANRRNALRSTGPRSVPGKNQSRANALTHAHTAEPALRLEIERAARLTYCAALVGNLDPQTELETQLAQSIAEDYWRITRARAIENGIFERLDSPHDQTETFLAHSRELGLLTIYEQRISRNAQRNVLLLRKIQAERAAARAKAFEEAKLLAQINYLKDKPYDPAYDFPAKNGFVFSIPEINTALRRDQRLRQAKHNNKSGFDPTYSKELYKLNIIDTPDGL